MRSSLWSTTYNDIEVKQMTMNEAIIKVTDNDNNRNLIG